MTIHEGADLHKKVERYVAAVEELRAAHEDVRGILVDQILFARWQQLGADLGFSAEQPAAEQATPRPHAHRDMALLNQQSPDIAGSWAS